MTSLVLKKFVPIFFDLPHFSCLYLTSLHSLCTIIYSYLPYFTLNFIYILGFLSTEDESASGNYGLKDQTMALQWIKEHITEFGGDPSNVTIQGESSAAVDVALHLISPLSKG